MTRSTRLTIVIAAFCSIAGACSTPTGPSSRATQPMAPNQLAPSADGTTDPLCRSGYNVTNGHTC